jgi:hypothetical protein
MTLCSRDSKKELERLQEDLQEYEQKRRNLNPKGYAHLDAVKRKAMEFLRCQKYTKPSEAENL